MHSPQNSGDPPGGPLGRAAFLLTVVLAGSIVWVAPRPPMGDLPEHAAQVALLRDMALGRCAWADLVRINCFTPYLTGYALAFALSLVLPVIAALKAALSIAYYAFVWACLALRKSFSGDPRLDWLFVPGFFGFAFQYGLYPFLIAIPVSLGFLLVAKRFAEGPTRRRAVAVVAAGVALFFSHGIAFVFACGIGAGFLLIRRETALRRAWTPAPYVILGVLAVTHFVYVKAHDPVISIVDQRLLDVEWDWFKPWGWHRAVNFPLFALVATGKDPIPILCVLVVAAAPWLLGLRPRRDDPVRWIPLLMVAVAWFLVPAQAMTTNYLSQRFAILLLPAYAFLFPRPDGAGARSPSGDRRSALVQTALALACWAFLALVAVRQREFARESAPFEEVLSAAEPGERALGLVYSPESAVVRNPYTFHVYPVWYEVDRRGFVDFNFAYFPPEMVRFRPGHFPPVPPGFDERPETFNWRTLQARRYRYFFVRHLTPLPDGFFENEECRVVLRKQAGAWSLFERTECSEGEHPGP